MLPLRLSKTARNQVDKALAWWTRNRDKAPDALIEELDEAAWLISTTPLSVGRHGSKARGVRRLYLPRVRYYLYYRVVGSPPAHVEIVGLWHVSRSARVVREPAPAYAVVLAVRAIAA